MDSDDFTEFDVGRSSRPRGEATADASWREAYGGSTASASSDSETQERATRATDRFARDFERFDTAAGAFQVSWHWPAALLGPIWYLKEGLWRKALIYFVALLILSGLTAGAGFIFGWLAHGLVAKFDSYLAKQRDATQVPLLEDVDQEQHRVDAVGEAARSLTSSKVGRIAASEIARVQEQRRQTQARNEGRRRAEQELSPDVYDFSVASNYHGGYPGLTSIIDGGRVFVTSNGLVWVGGDVRITIPYTDVIGVHLDNFKVSFMRTLIGGNDNDVHRLKNTLVVKCFAEEAEQEVRIEMAGALSIHGTAQNAEKVLSHLAPYRKHFRREVPENSGVATGLSIELERLADLYDRGILDRDEFRSAKKALLGGGDVPNSR